MGTLTLDISKLLREAGVTAEGSASLDFSQRDFSGFTVPGPVDFAWRGRGAGGVVKLELWLTAELCAECVRCLEPTTAPLQVEKEYDILPEDLQGEYTEYPAAPGGGLDLLELAYGEVVLEAPILTVCREDCPGLCPVCGRPKAGCGCADEPPPARDDAPPAPDPRWDALRALLDDEAE